LQEGRQESKKKAEASSKQQRFVFVADSCQPCLELPDEARGPREVSRVSEGVSGREAKTETNKLIRKECYTRKTDRKRKRRYCGYQLLSPFSYKEEYQIT
jgi:hypothetical protein